MIIEQGSCPEIKSLRKLESHQTLGRRGQEFVKFSKTMVSLKIYHPIGSSLPVKLLNAASSRPV